MTVFRDDLQDLEPYKLPGQAIHNLGDNENRLIDWTFLLEESLEQLKAGELSFYGDNRYAELIEIYANYLGVQPQQVTAGVGSDFLVHMIIIGALKHDEVFLTINPDFFMYEVYNQIHGSRFVSYDLPQDKQTFVLKADDLLAYAKSVKAKMIMFSNPNNPSSVAFDSVQVEKIIAQFDGLVVIDEAYIEFADSSSFVEKINQYDNLIVLRTLSKAFGLAGIRLGFAVAQEQLIVGLDKIIPPYSLSNVTAKIGTLALAHRDLVVEKIAELKSIRTAFIEFLQAIPDCRVLPSQANFVTFSAPWSKELYEFALTKDWNFKYYSQGVLANHIRMAIGRPEEMDAMKKMIKEVAGI